MLHLFKLLLLLSVCLLSTKICADTVSADVPYCTSKQLEVYEIATDFPGMMKSHSLYGIINTSQQACHLNGAPVVKGIAGDQKTYLSARAKQNINDVIVEPLTNPNSISSDKLVWFSFSGNAASDGTPFKTIQVILPGITGHPYTVDYHGYSTAVSNLSPIQKNAALWDALKNDGCKDFTGKVWPIYFKKTINCS